ncbi:MAG: AAC(3) family N-acetyltransferase [Bacteroides sp.]
MKAQLRKKIISIAKKLLGLRQYEELELRTLLYRYRLIYGPLIYKKRFTTQELVCAMKDMGMTKGSNVFIHSKWDEMYNYDGNENELIESILDVIGSEGTLIMPAFPLIRKKKIFNVKRTVTAAGLLPEAFRKYPGVVRSINIQHSICAIGANADYLISEHHKGDNCWDEKSPYYKLADLDTLVFSIGLRKYYIGAMVHCVEGILMKSIPYYRDFFMKEKNDHFYIDSDGETKSYKAFDLDYSNRRISKHFGARIMTTRYFSKDYYEFRKLSNVKISMYKANLVIPKMIELGKKGIDIYKSPSKKGYKFY